MSVSLQDFADWDLVGKADPLPPVTEIKYAPGMADPFAVLRARCDQSETETRTKITIVGGVFKNGRLHPNDQSYLEHTFNLCEEQNFRWSRNFSVTIINNADDNVKGDFLKNPVATDILVIACLPNVSASHDDPNCRGVARSPLHRITGSWYKAAENSGAAAVFAFGGVHEVTTRHFSPDRNWAVTPHGILQMIDSDAPNVYRNWIARTYEADTLPLPMTSLIRKDMAARLGL